LRPGHKDQPLAPSGARSVATRPLLQPPWPSSLRRSNFSSAALGVPLLGRGRLSARSAAKPRQRPHLLSQRPPHLPRFFNRSFHASYIDLSSAVGGLATYLCLLVTGCRALTCADVLDARRIIAYSRSRQLLAALASRPCLNFRFRSLVVGRKRTGLAHAARLLCLILASCT
jgi:hypothetical protein